MRKLYTLLLLSFIVGASIQAQIEFQEEFLFVSLVEEDVLGFPSTPFNYIINNSTETVNITWERTKNELLDGWTSSVCDEFLCYPSEQGTGTVEILPGDSAKIKVQFNPNNDNLIGLNAVEITVIGKSGGMSDTLTASFSGEIFATSIEDVFFEEKSVDIYPNPVINNLFIELNNYPEAAVVEVYNMVGKRVEQFFIENTEEIQNFNLFDLQEGMYFVSLLDNNNQLLETKRFSKVR